MLKARRNWIDIARHMLNTCRKWSSIPIDRIRSIVEPKDSDKESGLIVKEGVLFLNPKNKAITKSLEDTIKEAQEYSKKHFKEKK